MDEGDRSDSEDEPAERTESSVGGTDDVDDGDNGDEAEDGSEDADSTANEGGTASSDGATDVGSGSDEIEPTESETGAGGSPETSDADPPRDGSEVGGDADGDEADTVDEIDTVDGIDTVDERAGEPHRGGSERDEDRTAPTETDANEGLPYRFRNDREGILMWIREMLSSVAIVLVIGLILFGVSGVWPPMVAVESGSMEPNMEVGDLVFVTDPGRLAPDAADNDVGVVTHEVGASVDYRTFGSYGSVVIYRPPGRTASPIIHRAMFRVEEGENWYDRADEEYHGAANCAELRHCPAPHDGFITLGDNNGAYDQANGLAAPVRAEWVTGVARLRVPYLGYVRLIATGQAEVGDILATGVQTGAYGAIGSDMRYRIGGSDVASERPGSISGGPRPVETVG